MAVERDLDRSRHQPADEVEGEEQLATPRVLQQQRDRVEEQHVADDVEPPGMQEHVGDPADLLEPLLGDEGQPAEQGRAQGGDGRVREPVELCLLEVDDRVRRPAADRQVVIAGPRHLPAHGGVEEALLELRWHLEVRALLPVLDDAPGGLPVVAERIGLDDPGPDEEEDADEQDPEADQREAHRAAFDADREEEEHAARSLAHPDGRTGLPRLPLGRCPRSPGALPSLPLHRPSRSEPRRRPPSHRPRRRRAGRARRPRRRAAGPPGPPPPPDRRGVRAPGRPSRSGAG